MKSHTEIFVDKMGLIVCLSGEARFAKIREFKKELAAYPLQERLFISEAIRKRFTPTNGQDGCESGMASVKEATELVDKFYARHPDQS